MMGRHGFIGPMAKLMLARMRDAYNEVVADALKRPYHIEHLADDL